jgi:2-polyprenyl-3-methyl-5-hydroxy-6-metoxy-1,4-benzoquinol methylase
LDVGCGDGLLFGRLGAYAAHIEGVEPDETLVSPERAAGGRIHIRAFDSTFRSDRPYDLILFLDVLEHMDDAAGVVVHAADLLEAGGVALVTVPAFRHLWTTHDDLNHHRTRYTRAELHALLSGALQVEKVRYFFRWVHPAKAVQRATEGVTRRQPTAPTVPPAPLNATMYAMSRVEEAVLGWSTIPVGSSLLAVARKR